MRRAGGGGRRHRGHVGVGNGPPSILTLLPAGPSGVGLSGFAARAGWLRAGLLRLVPLADRQARPVAAAGSAAGDALAALEAVTAGLRRRFGGLDKLAAHEVAAHLTGGMLLAPPLPALAGNTSLIAVAAAPLSCPPAGPARGAGSPV